MISQSMFVTPVPNLEKSSAFYRDVLHFQIHEMDEPGWRVYVNGNCTIMAAEKTQASPPLTLGDHAYFAYLVVDKVEPYYRRALNAKSELVKELSNEACDIREFGLRTVDGHKIMIGQALDSH